MVRIGSARIDENGNITGGEAGDQTGKEVAIEPFYYHKKGWLAFVPKDSTLGTRLAKAMIDACNNNKIGYDQNSRLGVFNQVENAVPIADIKNNVECDCSGLVRACILQASGKKLGNFNTTTEPSVLEKSGLFYDPFEVKNTDKLIPGTILVTKTKGHTAIVVEADNSNVKSEDIPRTKTVTSEKEDIQVAKYKDSKIAGTYEVICDLNLRTGGNVLSPIVAKMSKGSQVKCYGYFNKEGMNKWYAVEFNDMTGYCNAKYLRKV